MAVAAQQRPARPADSLQLHLMADAVAGLAEIDAVLFRHGGNVLMIVRVFKAGLQGIMVDIGHAALRFHPVNAHGFQLQIGHRPRGILRQRLIDPDRNFLARHQLALEQVTFQNFLCQIHRNISSKSNPRSPGSLPSQYTFPASCMQSKTREKTRDCAVTAEYSKNRAAPFSQGSPILTAGNFSTARIFCSHRKRKPCGGAKRFSAVFPGQPFTALSSVP